MADQINTFVDKEVITTESYAGFKRGELNWPASRIGFYSKGLYQILDWLTTIEQARKEYEEGAKFLRGVEEDYARALKQLVKRKARRDNNESKRVFYQYLEENMGLILAGIKTR